jgi:hypothetical protein
MSYQNLPDPRPLGVKFAIGRMPRGIAMALMYALFGASLVGLIGLCVDSEHPIAWGATSIVAVLLAVQYFVAIRWLDFHKSWPRRRSYRRHRVTR